MDDMDGVVQEFLVESHENLDSVDNDLLTLETSQRDPEVLAAIFRTIHSIKGTCGFLGFERLERLTHIGENLLSRMRDGELTANSEITSALLEMVDAVRAVLRSIEETGGEGDHDHTDLCSRLERLAAGENLEAQAPAAGVADAPVAGTAAESQPAACEAAAPVEAADPVEATPQVGAADPVEVADPVEAATVEPANPLEAAESRSGEHASGDSGGPPEDTSEESRAEREKRASAKEIQAGSIGDLLIQKGYVEQGAVEAALQAQEEGDPRHVGEILVSRGVLAAERLVEALRIQKASRTSNLNENSIRVNVELLDRLMNLVGELVLTRNQILQFQTGMPDGAFHATTQRLNLITSELQEGVMQTRMQPIGTVWDKFPRVIRDVAKATGKKVRIEVDGRDTELDKTIVEAIKDPLTHIIRNAVDHGIEAPDVRRRNGKDESGCLQLRAFHEGGQVNIEIADDGGGIDVSKVKRKAIEKGVLSEDQAHRMSERELTQLIFSPGFSTADTVTNISGRGVGMDVVRTNIEKIGGTLDVHSVLGEGTTIRVRIPLTLAIIPALIVRSGREQFAIPQIGLMELVRVDLEQNPMGIEYVQGAPVHRLRGDLLPLVFLDQLLGIAGDARPEDDPLSDGFNIVVLKADDQCFGLVVDEVTDTQEIVVKPLGRQLSDVHCFAGATIMGDGRVALILDIQGLARHAGVLSDVTVSGSRHGGRVSEGRGDFRGRYLVFSVGNGGRMAVPLMSVRRLEEVDWTSIERAGNLEVVQYRGRLLPLIDLRQRFGGGRGDQGATTPVIVHGTGDQSFGFVVQEIIDVVEETAEIEECSKRPGISGSAVLQGRVTDLLDPASFAREVRGASSV